MKKNVTGMEIKKALSELFGMDVDHFALVLFDKSGDLSTVNFGNKNLIFGGLTLAAGFCKDDIAFSTRSLEKKPT